MESKTYTAQEMRDFAEAIAGDLCGNGHRSVQYTYDDLIPVIESLRQAADAMEREAAKDEEMLNLRKSLARVMEVTGDCRKCEECGDETCPWFGEPDGCNNREGRELFLAGKLVDPLKAKDTEIAKLTADNMRMESLLNKAGETVVGLMNKMSAQDEEIKKLRAALKPVLAVCPSSYESHFVSGGCWRVPLYDGKLCEASVLEAQRIYKEVAK